MKDEHLKLSMHDPNSPDYVPASAMKQKILDLLEQLSVSYMTQAHLSRRVYIRRENEIKADLCSGLIKMIDRLID